MHYKVRIKKLFKTPLFWLLTFVGNLIILLGSLLLYYFESDSAAMKLEIIDCVLWSTSLTTTIGYNTYAPQTFGGKLTVIAMMVCLVLHGIFSYCADCSGIVCPRG